MKHAVVLLSGGLDSATTLAVARSLGYVCHALSFNYGQRHVAELQAARRVADALGAAEHRVVRLDLGQLGGSALTDSAIAVPEGPTEGIPVTYVPARNTVMLAYALAWTEVLGARDIFIGVNAVDYSGYPDCRDNTLKALQVALSLGLDAPMVVETPLMWLTKEQTWRLAEQLGGAVLVELIRTETHTCYLGNHTQIHNWGYGCGHCPACELRSSLY
jgi:7-cyano-7-deazaguanine synthase